MRKTFNKHLPFVKSEWTGNPLDEKGIYANLDGEYPGTFADVLKWKLLQKNKYAPDKKNQKSNVSVCKDKKFLDKSVDGITWLGHATFLLDIQGVRIVTDPILYDIWPLKRFTEVPCAIDELKEIDIILLSHNHRDHADKKSMTKIASLNPHAIIFTGLEIAGLLKGWGIVNEIIEAGWYQRYPEVNGSIQIDYLPAKHWNRRYLTDLNTMLWGSFMIQSPRGNIYFGADSGLGDHFTDIGKLYNIDLSILGIGAYEPVWFMKTSHTSPQAALKAKEMLGASSFVPMHYGTFDLSDEPIFNPKNQLSKLTKDRNDVHIINIGSKWGFKNLNR